jgi:predicted DNA-binding transcriptional regulator YafY
MTRANSYDRLRRLELIAAQLKQDELCTVRGLARQFNVSDRTIARDLSLLRMQGLPIDAERGRGGGVRLDRNWGVGRVNLSHAEAVDVLISIAIAEQMNSALFLTHLGAVRRQIVASFSPDKRQQVNNLKSRILIAQTSSISVQASFATPGKKTISTVQQAFVDRLTLSLDYRSEQREISSRTIEPHYLLLAYPAWYIVAIDYLRDAPRIFRCDRILSATKADERFTVLPVVRFRETLQGHELLI